MREQFPQEIEEKRKLLYPVAKKARQNKENRVRLVRDKLYVNGQKANSSNQEKSSKSAFNSEQRREENRSDYGNAIRGRTVNATRRSQPNRKP